MAWIEGTHRFVYRRTIAGGHEFVLVDTEKQTLQPAFDAVRLAETLSKALPPEALVAADDGGYDATPPAVNGPARGVVSPDGKWLAFVENYNVAVRPTKGTADALKQQRVMLSEDGRGAGAD